MSADEEGTPELPFASEGKNCLICGDKSDGTHFGAEACRACAAFFRRTIVSGKKYYCQSFDNCIIDKSARCMCRCCRFKKCFDVGMRREMVQGRRDPIIPRVKHGIKQGSSGNDCLPSTSKNIFPTSMPGMLTHIKKELEEPLLLQKIAMNYRNLRLARKSIELSIDPTITSRMHSSGPLMGYAMGSSTKMSIFDKACASVLFEFATSSFEEFEALTKEEQFSLFPSFISLVWGMDRCYHTYRHVPKDMFSTKMIVSETTYFDTNEFDNWMADMDPEVGPSTKADIVKTINQARQRGLKQLYIMSDMNLEEEEYAALLGLMLWNQNFETNSEKVDKIVKQMRDKLFQQLEIHYRWKGRESYATRLGELMGLHSTILIDSVRFREDLEVFNLLQAVEKGDLLFESMRNRKSF